MGRVILHSDMNCFYASVEMMLDPTLRGKAVAVCGATEDRHGIILAKSELAKKAGIKTGMVNWEAKQLCPNLIFVKPQYEQYLKYSALARAIYQRYTDQVEPYGMDECFLDVTGNRRLHGDGMQIAEQIRQTMKDELGLTVSIGVSFNKTFAKLGSDMKKPDAITAIPEDIWRDIVWPLPVSDLLFCGRATTKKLARYGVTTIGDLASLDIDFVSNLLGKNGVALCQTANGYDRARVQHKDFVSPVKSIGHGITCTADLENEEEVWRVILELSQDVGHRLRIHKLKARGVQLSIRDNDLYFKQYQGPLISTTQSPMDIAVRARELLNMNYQWKNKVRAVTVRAINLVPQEEPDQISLYMDVRHMSNQQKLYDCVDQLRQRFGKRIIYSASLKGDIKLPGYRDHGLIMPGMINR